MLQTLDQEWRDRVARCRFDGSLSFGAHGLTLGYGTVLLATKDDDPALITFDHHADHDRMVALFAVAGNGSVAKAGLLHLDAVLDEWRRGDKAMAAIRLAFARLPRLANAGAAYPRFWRRRLSMPV